MESGVSEKKEKMIFQWGKKQEMPTAGSAAARIPQGGCNYVRMGVLGGLCPL